MGRQTHSYRVRLARPDEVPRLRQIEDEAGTIFSGLGLIMRREPGEVEPTTEPTEEAAR